MASPLDEFGQTPRDAEKTLIKIGKKVATIEGQPSAPKKTPHPWSTALISVGSAALLAFWGWMGATLNQHGTTLAGIRQSLLGLGVTIAANTPTLPKSQTSAKETLAEARKSSIKIPQNIVRQAPNSFIEASKTNPNAWSVVLDFVTYQSSQNPAPRIPSITTPPDPTIYPSGEVPGRPKGRLMFSPIGVPMKDAARYEFIGKPANADVKTGPHISISRTELHNRQSACAAHGFQEC